ncbi:hypothetical protein BP354A_1056, partial [Burkholderia pseudomallei 354a]
MSASAPASRSSERRPVRVLRVLARRHVDST